jgi:SpoVK/Ycf46/Vps4 family AAA+-type ATPase
MTDNYNMKQKYYIPPYSYYHPTNDSSKNENEYNYDDDDEPENKHQLKLMYHGENYNENNENNKEVKPKQQIHIDVEIINIDSILHIIDTYEYNPDIEYNIDLKLLHNIHSELVEINNMVGINTFKESIINQLLYFMQELHINKEHDFKHMVIYGAPGTGKTQIAKLIGTMFSKLGILKNNIFRKVTRTDLIAGYLGQTAIKTNKVIQECLGGCLFIDEVYSLGSGDLGNNSFSKECIDTLCEALSNHKEELMVIVAGYKDDVNECFFKANQGLDSRFIWRFELDGYSPKELMRIFILKVENNGWEILVGNKLENWFVLNKDTFKHYGRDMELLFSYTKISHGRRIYGKDVNLRKKISMEDLENGFKVFQKHNSKKKEEIPYGLYI